MARQPVGKAWLSTSEAAKIAEVDQSTIIRWCQQSGARLARRVGSRWRVKPDALAKRIGHSADDEGTGRNGNGS